MSTLEGIKNWSIVFFSLGIGGYFLLPYDVDYNTNIFLIILTFLIALAVFFLRKNYSFVIFSCFAFLFMLGFIRAETRVKNVASPIIKEKEKFCKVSGWVERYDARERRKKLIIRVRNACHMAHPPFRIHISASTEIHVTPALGVEFKAILGAPPDAVAPETYRLREWAYFRKIGAYGYAVSALNKVDIPSQNIFENLERQLIKFRWKFSQKVKQHLTEPVSGLVSALLFGNRQDVESKTRSAFQKAGLAHLLAISGLHMGLIAGGAFVFFRLFFTFFFFLSSRYDVRKIAAVLGIVIALVYLIISGASVSAQRATIMIITAFLAMILDRQAFSLRSVMIAFFVVLLLRPESLFEAGFQMSFSAVIALIAFFELGRKNMESIRPIFKEYPYFLRWPLEIFYYIRLLLITSLIAGGTTSFFAAFYFHRSVSYGLISNILVLPIFTFVTMPAGVFTFILIPFGGEYLPLKIMNLSLEIIILIAEKAASLPFSSLLIKMAPFQTLPIYIFGFTLLCLGPKRILRIWGVSIIGIALILWGASRPPDIWVGKKGEIVIKDRKYKRLYITNTRRNSFGVTVFSELTATENYRKVLLHNSDTCTLEGCKVQIKNKKIIYLKNGVIPDCQKGDLILAPRSYLKDKIQIHQCEGILFSNSDLKKRGPCLFWLQGRYIFYRNTSIQMKCLRDTRQQKPWYYTLS